MSTPSSLSSTCCRDGLEAILGAPPSATPRLSPVGPLDACGTVVRRYSDKSQRVFGRCEFYWNETVDPCEVHEAEGIQRFVAELEGLR